MKVLFVHNNFPALFVLLACFLCLQPDVEVAAVGAHTARPVSGVKLLKYSPSECDASQSHPFARRFQLECYRAEQVLYNLTALKSSGFIPDVIMAHPGWGEALPIRSFFSSSCLFVFCVFF